MTCLLAWEVLDLFRERFSLQASMIEEKQSHILELASNFMEEVESEEHMRRLLHDCDLSGRSVSFLIKRHPQLLFKIETVIEAEWQGPIPVWRSNSGLLSTLYSAAKDNDPTELLRLRSYFWRRYQSLVNPLQFENFRRSSLLKYFYSLLLTLVVAFFQQLLVIAMLFEYRAIMSY